MKLKKVLAGGFILGMGVMSSVQLFASCNMGEQYKSNVVYAIENNTQSSSLESEYKDKFLSVLRDYLNVDTDKLPADATFSVTLKDRQTINDENQKLLNSEAGASEDIQSLIARHTNDTYDEVHCTLSLPCADDDIPDEYAITFNADTKAVISLDAPLSAEGIQILADETTAKISVQDLQTKYADFITRYEIGGIQNPKCITNQYAGTNAAGNIPVLIYQDQNDQNKQVTIGLDGATGSISYIFVW